MNLLQIKQTVRALAGRSEELAPMLSFFITSAQATLESKFIIPAMEKTSSGTLAANTNVIPVPADYSSLIYLQIVDANNGTPNARMLKKASELELAQWELLKGLSFTWTLSTAVSLGDVIIPTAGTTTYGFKVTTAGTTGATEPTWPTTLGGTVVNGGVTFTAINKYETSFPSRFVRFGSNFVTSETATSAYTYNVRYYAPITALANDTDTNWWSTNKSELLIYGTLLNAIPYVDNPKMNEWMMQYERLMKEFRTALGREKFSGDRQQFSTSQSDIGCNMNVYR